jgi:hypothetical protein
VELRTPRLFDHRHGRRRRASPRAGRAQAGRATFARLERTEVEALAERAVRERLRPLLAEALTGGGALPLDGTPVEMVEGPVTFTLRLNDSAGLADLYFAPPALLVALPGGAGVAGRRAEVIGALPPGERFPTLASSLARLGADRATRQGLGAVLTRSGAPGALNGPTIPAALRPAATTLGLIGARPVGPVRVGIGRE